MTRSPRSPGARTREMTVAAAWLLEMTPRQVEKRLLATARAAYRWAGGTEAYGTVPEDGFWAHEVAFLRQEHADLRVRAGAHELLLQWEEAWLAVCERRRGE